MPVNERVEVSPKNEEEEEGGNGGREER